MDCARNIITANFSGGGTSATTAPLWQWDYSQVLCITGIEDLPAAFEVHFSTNRTGGVSTVAVGADGQVTIPNVLLTIGKNLNAWIYLSDAQGEGETEYSITIPVKARPMPETYDAEATGEFDDVVRQVSEYAQTAQTAADNAGASATAAATSADNAAASASAAETAKTAAETAQGKAEDAQVAAETAAQTARQKAQQTAQDAEQAASDAGRAESAAQRAETAQTGAESAVLAAEAAARDAAASASAASASATSAGQAASAAAQSASAAAQSAASIEGDVQTATQKANEATTAAGQAVTAKDAAVTAQTAAETAATNAGQSASTATTKAAEAAQSASSAAQSKTDAEAAATRAEQAAATLTVDDALSDTSENPVQNKVITGEVTQLKNALAASQIINSASGAIASFPDGAAMPMESLTVDLEPIQDLNGQDAPYPAGAINLLNLALAQTTVSGATISSENEIVSISGTTESPGYGWVALTNTVTLAAGTYYIGVQVDKRTQLTGIAIGTSNALVANVSSISATGFKSASFTLEAETTIARIRPVMSVGVTVDESFCIIISKTEQTGWHPYSNVCPITGRESVTVTRAGKNLLEKPAVYYTTIGRNLSDCFFVKAGEYNFSVASMQNATSWRWAIMLKDKDGADLSDMGHRPNQYMTWNNPNGFWIGGSNSTSKSIAINVVEDCYIRIIFAVGDTSASTVANDAQLELGRTATAYEPYDGQSATIQLGQTVYGGNAEIISGQGENTMALATFTDGFIQHPIIPTLFYRNNSFTNAGVGTAYCNQYKYAAKTAASLSAGEFVIDTNYTRIAINTSAFTSETALNAYLAEHPLQVAYPRATPIEIDLTPEQMTTLKGQNNVWSDADSVTVEYVADPKLYIARLTEPDADMVADSNIISGSYFMVGNSLYLATANIASGAAIVPGVNCTRTNLAAALNAINA